MWGWLRKGWEEDRVVKSGAREDKLWRGDRWRDNE